MTGRQNNKTKAVKAISVALSIYMALSPVVVHADELSDAENNVSVQDEAKAEAADDVKEAVENAKESDDRIEFENEVADVDVSDIESEYTIEVPSVSVEDVINDIENDAIKDAANAIVSVDMSDVDAALDEVAKEVDKTVTDETVAAQMVESADALIEVYEAQADAALNVLTQISEYSDAVTVLDGSVSVDWNVATDEVKALYAEYQKALQDKADAESVKKSALDKVAELDCGVADNKISDKISESKLNKNDDINDLIGTIVANYGKPFSTSDDPVEETVKGSNDIYKFFINTIKDGIIYGCLTYYDSENKIILRKNFSISADGDINYEYVPKSEWVKGDANCKQEIFGNGGNYIAASVEKESDLISIKNNKKEFQGKKISELLRGYVGLNNAIDVAKKAENDFKIASDNADSALKEYKKAVALYKDVASLEDEIKKDEVEKAKLEYVKAEVEAWRSQQILNQVKDAINNSNTPDTVVKNNTPEKKNIEAVVNTIAANLGVEPAEVESLVVQTIIDTEDNYVVANNNEVEVVAVTNEVEPAEEVIDTQKEDQDIITIEDSEVPLASFGGPVNIDADASYVMNWWKLFVIELTCAAWVIFLVARKKKENR